MEINQPQSLEDIQALLGDLPNTQVPAALFPIRLETRFTTEAGKIYLCVRIYPDDLHLETHEPLLTDDEVRWGKHLWEQVWLSGRDRALEKALQDELTQRFGPGRAAWIIKTLKPLNPEDRSNEPNHLPVKPIYPEIETRSESWTRPPSVKALPDRWVLFGYPSRSSQTLTVLSNPVPPDLTAGLDPQDLSPTDEAGKRLLEQRDDDTQLPLDDRMKWLVDFDTAVEQGMGFRIELESQQTAEEGFRRLIVLGLSTQSSVQQSAQSLEALLTAQRYTDSLDFVPQGAPSNTTEDSTASYSATEPEQETEFLSQTRESPVTQDCNCHIAARALGISPEIFAQLPHTLDREQTDAQAMNAVLWPATWGYFLRYMVSHVHGHLTDEAIEKLRTYFIRFVRARGPIPTIRVGQQPYGILPVTSLDRYQPNPTHEQEIFGHPALEILKKLRDRWQDCLPHIPRVEPKSKSEDLAPTLANILGMQAVSDTVQGRLAFDGLLYGMSQSSSQGLQGLPVSQDPALAQGVAKINSLLNRFLGDLNNSDATMPAASFVFTEPIFKLSSNGHSAEPRGFVDLVNRIKSASFSNLSHGLLREAEQQSPLALLLRHSMLLAYLDTAYHLSYSHGHINPETHRDPAFVGILTDPNTNQAEETATLLQLLERPLSDFELGNGTLLKDVIHTFDANRHPSARILDDMRENLDHLATVPPKQLNGLLGETLDLASHRLDAWITALATARLDNLRQQQPQGLVLGGYGWVENLKLKPSGASQTEFGDRTRVSTIPDGESEEGTLLYESSENGGFALAPSINQATTAAILRSGYLNHQSRDAAAPFSIDLSSDRVRLAKWLLDGVRQGQSLGTLLGYRFERQLQEQGLGSYILPFRKLVPFGAMLRQDPLNESTFINQYRESHLSPATLDREAIESIEAQHVVDGLELMRLRQNNKVRFGNGKNEIRLEKTSDRPKIEAILESLIATVDAVSDLITAESVFQLAQGNELLAGGTLDSIARGETPPPNPEIVHTPRSGIAHTHRLPLLFSGEFTPLTTWTTDSYQQRARLEPHLNHWLGHLLGDAERIKIKLAFWDSNTDTIIHSASARTLKSFLLSPLDVIALASDNETGTGSTLETLITYRVMLQRPDSVPADATLRVFYDREADWAADELDFGTLNEFARAARDLIAHARPLNAQDLIAPEDETPQNLDADELNQRASHLVNAFQLAHHHLVTTIHESESEGFQLSQLRNDLFRFFFVGINEAVPCSAKDDEPSAKARLLDQAQTIKAEADRRIEALNQVESSLNRQTADLIEKIETDIKRIKIIFGEDFPVLPKFTLNNAEELMTTYGDSFSLQNQDPLAAVTWLGQMAPVRAGCDRLNTCLTYAETLYPDFSPHFTVGQLPSESGDRWVALPDSPTRPITEPRVALMTLAPYDLALDSPISGLLVDEWVEIIPNEQEIAAAAFHFDAPQSQPPHSILLAVPPDNKEKWELSTLEAIVLETLDLAKLRTVDNAALFHSADRGAFNDHGHFLPALYFAFNPELNSEANMTTTVSTDFSAAADKTSESFPPSITDITPLLAVRDRSTLITIQGDNLAEASEVLAAGATSIDTPEIISNSEIRVRVTFGGSQKFSIFNVMTPNGSVESDPNRFVFEIKDQAILSSLSPFTIQKGQTINATIRGNHLAETSNISFTGGGLQVSNLEINNTQIQCRIKASSSASTGKRRLKVTTPAGTQTSSFELEVKNPPPKPSLTNISPKIFIRGQSEMRFTIRGSNLLGATTVRFFNRRGSGPNIGIGSRIVSVRSSTEIEGRISIDRTTREEDYNFEVFFGSNSRVSNSNLTIKVVDLGEPIPPKPKPPGPGPVEPF